PMSVAGRRGAAKMEEMVRARVCDPTGPRWLRRVTPTIAAVLILFSPIAPLVAGLRATGLLLGAALFFARRVIRLRFRAREAGVRVHPGSIEIVEAGLLDQPVHASDVVAASTARTAGGVALAIVRRGSTDRPLVLDFASEADLDAVRRPLGLGHFGFGEVAWPTRVRSVALQGSTLLAIAWLAIAVCAAADLTLVGLTLGLVIIPITVVAMLVACLEEPHGPRVALTSAGIRFTEMPAWIPPIRYAEVRAASVDDAGVLLTTNSGPVMVPMGRSLPEEREHLAAQVLSAAARAPEPARPSRAPQRERAGVARAGRHGRRVDRDRLVRRRLPRKRSRSEGPLDGPRETGRAGARARRGRAGPRSCRPGRGEDARRAGARVRSRRRGARAHPRRPRRRRGDCGPRAGGPRAAVTQPLTRPTLRVQ